jgi:hypothetical protein
MTYPANQMQTKQFHAWVQNDIPRYETSYPGKWIFLSVQESEKLTSEPQLSFL